MAKTRGSKKTTVRSRAARPDVSPEVARITRAVLEHAEVLEELGRGVDEALGDGFHDAPPPELRARAARLRSVALHCLQIAAQLHRYSGRLEGLAWASEGSADQPK